MLSIMLKDLAQQVHVDPFITIVLSLFPPMCSGQHEVTLHLYLIIFPHLILRMECIGVEGLVTLCGSGTERLTHCSQVTTFQLITCHFNSLSGKCIWLSKYFSILIVSFMTLASIHQKCSHIFLQIWLFCEICCRTTSAWLPTVCSFILQRWHNFTCSFATRWMSLIIR